MILIISGWILGMGGYIVMSKLSSTHCKSYYDVKANIKRFKKIRDEVNGVEPKIFK
jgi:hypothetical protein